MKVLEGCLGRIVIANSFAAILWVVAAVLLICCHRHTSCHERLLPPNTNTLPLIDWIINWSIYWWHYTIFIYTFVYIPFFFVPGLVGPLLICKKGTLDATGKQKNIDKEFILFFTVTNENMAWYIKRNAKTFAGSSYKYGKFLSCIFALPQN